MLWKIFHIAKEIQHFQLELCEIIPKKLLLSLSGLELEYSTTFHIFEIKNLT